MEDNITIKEILEKVEKASTDFEKANTELKRKYLIWNIETFNIIASAVSVGECTFGTGYPFYALDENLNGTLPIIPEQIRYNRQLMYDGRLVQKSIYHCKSCLTKRYETMPDLKKFCIPCPNMLDVLKPRKLINRLPDIDMWLVCKDGCIKQAQKELANLLDKYGMHTSDKAPFTSIEDLSRIAEMIKRGEMPTTFLPIDAHIIEYSVIKKLIEQVPEVLSESINLGIQPFLPIQPKSYRKYWQYDEAYNYIYDYLSAFTPFNFPEELQQVLKTSRREVVTKYTPDQLFDFLVSSATQSNARRFCEPKLEEIFKSKVKTWGNDSPVNILNQGNSSSTPSKGTGDSKSHEDR